MRLVMSGHILALATLFPTPATAQGEEVRAPWVMEVAGGLALRSGDATARSLGFSQAISVGRMISDRTSWRGTVEFDTWLPPSCSACMSQESLSMLAFSFGVVATEESHHREFYATARAGVYVLVDTPAPSPGGYVGVGAAIPINRAALTIEAGLQGYYYISGTGPDDQSAGPNPNSSPSPDHNTWAIPIRVGYRWAL